MENFRHAFSIHYPYWGGFWGWGRGAKPGTINLRGLCHFCPKKWSNFPSTKKISFVLLNITIVQLIITHINLGGAPWNGTFGFFEQCVWGTYLFVIEQFQFVQKIFHYHKWHVHQSRSTISNSSVIINLFTLLIVPTWWSSGASRHFVLFANENQLLSPKCNCLALCLLFTCFFELNPGMKWIGMFNSFGNDSSRYTCCVFLQHVHIVSIYVHHMPFITFLFKS